MLKTLARLKHLLVWGKWLFTPLALIFLLGAAWQSRAALGETLAHSLPAHLLLALLAYMVAHLISPLFASVVLRAGGAKVGYWQTLDLHLRYLPARYLPGGIWHTVARVHRLHSLGVRPRQLSSFVILENLMALCVTLSVGGWTVAFYPQGGGIWGRLAIPIATTSLLMLVLLPFAVNRWVLTGGSGIRPASYARAVTVVVAFWSCMVTAFLLFIAAFPQTFTSTAWLEITGAYLFAWGMGFIAIFAPQGVGVFEVVAADLLPSALTFSALAALLVGFRLLVLLADMLLWMGWAVLHFSRRA